MKGFYPWPHGKFFNKKSKTHKLTFESASVHHILTVALKGKTDLARWVRLLLDADLASSAAWPSETAVRVSYRLRKPARLLRSVRSSVELLKIAEESQSWKAALHFAWRHPRIGTKFVRAKWISQVIAPHLTEFAESGSFRILVKLFLRFPVFTIFHVLPKIRINFGKKREQVVSNSHETDEPLLAQDEGHDPSEIDLLAPINEAEELYLNQQVVSAAIRQSDSQLFGGADRDSDGFVRLMLRESYHDFILPGSEQVHHVVFEPRLLLHESGVAQIDLVLNAATALNVRQVLAMTWGSEPIIIRSQMSTPLLRGTSWEGEADFSAQEVDAGQPLGVIEHTEPVSMIDLLHLYLAAVLRVINRSYTFWSLYPVAIVGSSPCCGPEGWQLNHKEDIIRLTIRSAHDGEVSKHIASPTDLSLSRDHSLFTELGSAIYLQWDGAPPTGIAELNTALIFEHAQLLYVRLHSLEADVSRMVGGERKLRNRYRAAVRLFSELRQRDLRSGEARNIVRHVFDDLGVSNTRATIETALSLSAAAYSTRSAERAASRAWWITLLATLLGLLVAVPPLQDLLKSVPPTEAGEAWPLTALRWLSEQGFWGPWIILSAILISVFLLRLLGWLWRWRIRRFPSFRRGYKWPAEFTFAGEEYSPAGSSPPLTESSADVSGIRDEARN